MRKVEVISYQETWELLFQNEKTLIRLILQDEIIKIHHIGSTSVVGMSAKPVIDILVTVKNIEQIDRYNSTMEGIGYEAKGENGLTGRRFFIKGGNERSHHLHIYQKSNPEIKRHIAFRDYMRAFPEERQIYSRLKHKLAAAFPASIEKYIEGKHNYIQAIEKEALKWFEMENAKGDLS
jgi:GrpB-like predicted nucleotidyltransferase (UPF0157 family)